MTIKITHFRGAHRFLSNFYPARVLLDGQQYLTVEHAYQAAKTLIPGERTLIRMSPRPEEAKHFGKQITLRKGWDAVKLDVMRDLLRAKFHHISLRALLLATGDAELIEGNNWNDRFWGVCKGEGENHLGRLLMETRAKYKSGEW